METQEKQPCIEFPFFGARYPDATCIDGYLWDLDSNDAPDGGLTQGGETPCPFCNKEAFIDLFADPTDPDGRTREEVEAEIQQIYARWGNPRPTKISERIIPNR